jgi:hypothetical protein
VTLSLWATVVSRAGSESRMNAYRASPPASVCGAAAVAVARAVSNGSRGSAVRLRFTSTVPRTRNAAAGTFGTTNRPVLSATAKYVRLSAPVASTTARGAGRPFTQSNTTPRNEARATGPPVENTVALAVSRTLLRRSCSPGSTVTVYVVFGRNPRRGRTASRSRRQSTAIEPLRGDTVTSVSSPDAPVALTPPPPRGVSLTTASYSNTTSRARTLVAPDSGDTRRSRGGVRRSGPPGGCPGDAHAAATASAAAAHNAATRRPPVVPPRAPALTRRRGPRSSPRAGRAARPTPLLVALGLDHGGRRARREARVPEPPAQRAELLVELFQLLPELVALLVEVDEPGERHDHLGAAGEQLVRRRAGGRRVDDATPVRVSAPTSAASCAYTCGGTPSAATTATSTMRPGGTL